MYGQQGGKEECDESGDWDCHIFKQVTDENKQDSTQKSTRCSVVTYMGWKSKKE